MRDIINFNEDDNITSSIYKLEKFYRNKGKKYFIKTFGCQMNVHESEEMAGILETINLEACDSSAEADVIVLNTCCVRETAESKIKGYIGALKRLKRENEDLIIVLCGCMTQQEDVSAYLMKTFRHVSIIMGSSVSYMLPVYLNEVLENKSRVNYSGKPGITIGENIPMKRDFEFTAWINIMYGCNNFCSYCIVPYVRGRERSREFLGIINEAKDLADKGYVEITLLGQNVNSYIGENGETFPDLLRALNKIDGLKRIRFMTSHPKDLSDDLIDVIATCDNVSNHVHLPMQSGSSRVLKAMNRGYDAQHFLAIVEKLRNRIPDVGLTSDIIVGYPGETHEEYLETLSMIKRIKFDSAFTFKYSKRSGTVAAKHENEAIDPDEKQARLAELLATQNEITKGISAGYVGRVLEVLCEKQNDKDETLFSGRSDNGHRVSFHCNKNQLGKILKVKIIQAKVQTLIGELI